MMENGDLFRRSKIVFQCSSSGEMTRRIVEGAACGAVVVTDALAGASFSAGADGASSSAAPPATMMAVVILWRGLKICVCCGTSRSPQGT